MPVTILNTGTFNGGTSASPAAGVARSTGAGLAITGGASATAGLAGDVCATASYGTGTQQSAWDTWESLTGRTIQVWRVYYPGLPPSSISAVLSSAITNGIAVAMSFKPTLATTLGGGSSTDRSTINSFLASCKSAGLQAMCCMYHEPVSEVANANTYAFTQQYYGPTVRNYYPLVYCGQCGDFAHGSLANYQLYYNTAVTAGATFDAAAVDYYSHASWTLGGSTLMDGHAAFTDGQGLSSFGVWELGLDEDLVSQAVGTAWWNYMTSFFSARVSAGKGIGYVTHYNPAAPDGTGGYPFSASQATYQIPLFDAMWDAVNS